ncbi:MAG: chromosomal replication initiator protein DnaA [Myxococcales bacterium]|nr:chromosomal replication initiator protein DnaA [Myxococcales bacterium]MCB9669881.1 chromosomal replication initiator protein DnaA [Alphaproteobacteria bacterium]MCB9693245.1 chromosomal replication initiator protein DnaA [Alphaproteobacteria bacterium]
MDLTSFWEGLLDAMRQRIGAQEVEIWLADSRVAAVDHDRLVIEVNNRLYADWIRDNYLGSFEEIVARLAGRPLAIEFTFANEPAVGELPLQIQTPQPRTDMPRAVGLNPRQTFDEFVVGECNRFAHAAARAVADHPASHYNPLYIYGSTGLGKTHLMHAIGNHVLGTPAARVVYVTAEDFTNEMIHGIRYERMNAFRSKYRRAATVLLVDDIQFLSGKMRTQEEFFHTFNALQASGRQIVITSDVVPGEIEGLEPRLRTRFEGGLIADMQAPDPETLMAILSKKADGLRLTIPPDLADAIVARVAGNVRELEGTLNRLSALRNFYDRPLTLAFAQEQLPKLFEPTPTGVTVGAIIEAVARFHSLRSADLTGNKRTRTLTRPRHIAMYLARRHTKLSFPELGREFGGRDHSTIQHGFRKVEKELPRDDDLAHKVRLIEQALKVRA